MGEGEVRRSAQCRRSKPNRCLADQVADRGKTTQRIVVELSQQRIDQKWRRDDEERRAIRRRACDCLGADRPAGSRPVFDDHGWPAGAPGLLRYQPRDNIGGAPGA